MAKSRTFRYASAPVRTQERRHPSTRSPDHSGLKRDEATHGGTEKKRSLTRDIAASGAFSQGVAGVVAGVGFEPT